MVRTRIEIDGSDFELGSGQDVNEIMSRIKAAAGSPPEFVSALRCQPHSERPYPAHHPCGRRGGE